MGLRKSFIFTLGLLTLVGCQTSNSEKSKESVGLVMSSFEQERQFEHCLGNTAEALMLELDHADMDLSNLGIDDACLNDLLPVFRVQENITSLNLSNNKIGDDGLANLLVDLHGSQLQLLNLHKNPLTEASAVALGTYAQGHRALSTLILSDTMLGDRGTCVMMQHLKQRSALWMLDLENTGIQAEGGACVFGVLEGEGLPKFLILNNNALMGLDLSYLSLKDDHVLHHLALDNTQLDDIAVQSLRRLLPHLWSLHHLSTADNRFSKDGLASLIQAIAVHPSLNFWDLNFTVLQEGSDDALDKLRGLKSNIIIEQ